MRFQFVCRRDESFVKRTIHIYQPSRHLTRHVPYTIYECADRLITPAKKKYIIVVQMKSHTVRCCELRRSICVDNILLPNMDTSRRSDNENCTSSVLILLWGGGGKQSGSVAYTHWVEGGSRCSGFGATVDAVGRPRSPDLASNVWRRASDERYEPHRWQWCALSLWLTGRNRAMFIMAYSFALFYTHYFAHTLTHYWPYIYIFASRKYINGGNHWRSLNSHRYTPQASIVLHICIYTNYWIRRQESHTRVEKTAPLPPIPSFTFSEDRCQTTTRMIDSRHPECLCFFLSLSLCLVCVRVCDLYYSSVLLWRTTRIAMAQPFLRVLYDRDLGNNSHRMLLFIVYQTVAVMMGTHRIGPWLWLYGLQQHSAISSPCARNFTYSLRRRRPHN